MEVKDALLKASVSIYKELLHHVAWTGEHMSGSKRKPKALKNASGDNVLAIDILADKAVEAALKACPLVAGFASEERDDFVMLNPNGKYIVVYDPLDGSQNIPVGITVGAIFGVFRATSLESIKSGDEMVAAGYAVFSTCLLFTFATSKSPVSLSQYDFHTSNWKTIIADHKMPDKGKTYSINEGNCANWPPLVSSFVAQCLRGRSVRWMCCMVADVHRPLLQGGCFLYPADQKYPKGRLRLVYEAYPMAFLWEKAGGCAYRNEEGERILSQPFPKADVHVRCGVLLLGPSESKRLKHMREHLPVHMGGDKDATVRSITKSVNSEVKGEMGFLRTALVLVVLSQCLMLYKLRSNTTTD